jgi:hypothetical protein
MKTIFFERASKGKQKNQRSFTKSRRRCLLFEQKPYILEQIGKIFSGDKMLQSLTGIEA